MSHVMPTTRALGAIYRNPTELCSTLRTTFTCLGWKRKQLQTVKVCLHLTKSGEYLLIKYRIRIFVSSTAMAQLFSDHNDKNMRYTGFLYHFYYSTVRCMRAIAQCIVKFHVSLSREL